MPPRHERWQDLLRGAFAFQTAPFAGHPLDDRRAVKMFHAALRAGAAEADILAEAKRYLTEERCHPDEIERQLQRIARYRPRPTSKHRSSRAWLVTLEGSNGTEKIVSVFKAQRSADFVREYIEQYYIDHYYTPREKLLYAATRKNNPYPAQYESIEGVPWQGRITCGHNPFLYGRLVANLEVVATDSGEQFVWTELPAPSLPK